MLSTVCTFFSFSPLSHRFSPQVDIMRINKLISYLARGVSCWSLIVAYSEGARLSSPTAQCFKNQGLKPCNNQPILPDPTIMKQ